MHPCDSSAECIRPPQRSWHNHSLYWLHPRGGEGTAQCCTCLNNQSKRLPWQQKIHKANLRSTLDLLFDNHLCHTLGIWGMDSQIRDMNSAQAITDRRLGLGTASIGKGCLNGKAPCSTTLNSCSYRFFPALFTWSACICGCLCSGLHR